MTTNFLQRIAAQQSSFLLFSDHVRGVEYGNGFADVMTAGGVTFGLPKSLSFSEFERFDEQVDREEIGAFTKSYVQRRFREFTELSPDKRTRLKILRYMMDEIMPHLVARGMGDMRVVDKNAESPVEMARRHILTTLEEKFGIPDDIEDGSERMRHSLVAAERARLRTEALTAQFVRPVTDGSVLGTITGGQPLYVDDGICYQLVPEDIGKGFAGLVRSWRNQTPTMFPELQFSINGEVFMPTDKTVQLETLLREYEDRLNQTRGVRALENDTASIEDVKNLLRSREVSDAHMLALSQLQEYSFGDCGFVFSANGYYPYVEVPKFALQDSRNLKKFWPYDAMKVGVRLADAGNRVVCVRPAVVLGEFKNTPFFNRSRQNTDFSYLCNRMGTYDTYGVDAQGALRNISDQVQIIMGQFQEHSLRYCRHGDRYSYDGNSIDSYLKQKPLSEKKAKKEGYMIVYA